MLSSDQAFAKLQLPTTATPEEVKRRWRSLCSTLHPDRGGNPVEFDEMRRAYKLAHDEASAPKACPKCQGKGKVMTASGFHVVSLMCPDCGGSGHV